MYSLYLASSSPTRKQLLSDAGYTFEILRTSGGEEPFCSSASLKHNVIAAARHKGNHVVFPPVIPGNPHTIIVITADTLIADVHGSIMRKPHDLVDGKRQLGQLRSGPCVIGTACVIQIFKPTSGAAWSQSAAEELYSESTAEFYVPEDQLDAYFTRLPIALFACGSGIIEGFGAQFLKSFSGSYSGALGLPMFEIAKILKKLELSQTK